MSGMVTAAVVGAGAMVYSSNKASSAQKKAAAAGRDASEGANVLAFTQADIAEEQWDWHKANALPVMEGLATDAQGYDTPVRQDQMAGIAQADVGKSFGMQREAQKRDLMRYGVNPNSGKFTGLSQQWGVNEALGKAGAGTLARRAVDDAGFNRKLQAGQLISGQAAGVQAGLGSAASTLAASGAQQQNIAMQGAQGQGQLTGSLIGLGGNLASAYMSRPQTPAPQAQPATVGIQGQPYGSTWT